MVKYVPCDDSMKGFSTVEEMLSYICEEYGVSLDDIAIGEVHGQAFLLRLSNVRLVTANQIPIGICSID